jgi:surfeit locus 1 family protein
VSNDAIIRAIWPILPCGGRGPGVNRRRTLAAGWSLAVLAIAAFASLGRWQLARMHEKQAMLDAVQHVLDARRAQPLASAGDTQRARDYDWAEGEGTFAAAPPVLLDNQSRDQRPGVRAYRLFLARDGSRLLVELGWLPLAGDRRMPAVAAVPGPRRIRGLLMPPPSPGLAAAVAARQADGTIVTTAVDADDVAALLGTPALPPRVLRLDPALPLGYARDLDILPNTLPPQRHLGYAVQWFALAAAVLATALLLTFRKPRPTR